MKTLPTWEQIIDAFDYDPNTGHLTWKNSRLGVLKGSQAGCIKARPDGRKYLHVQYMNRTLLAHRIIFMLMQGFWPQMVDHINGDGTDNRWENLRCASPEENCKNNKRRKDNPSGYVGVRYRNGKWCARIRHQKREIHLGSFETKEQAVQARKVAEEKYGFHPNHGKR